MEETYCKKLERLSSAESAEKFDNSSSTHAADFLYVLIANAKENINIVSSKLALYSDEWICKAFARVLDNGVRVKILLDGKTEDINLDNAFLKIAKSHDNCQIKITTTTLNAHIVTRDNKAYGYREGEDQLTAFGSFNQPEEVANANKQLFGDFYNKQPAFITSSPKHRYEASGLSKTTMGRQ